MHIRIVYLLSSALFVHSGWVDPDTLHENKFLKSLKDDRIYELVFSDEFNTDGRYSLVQFHIDQIYQYVNFHILML